MKTSTFINSIVLCLITLFAANAQNYHQVAEQGKTWNIYQMTQLGSKMIFFKIDGDTTLNGNTYPRMIETDKDGNYIKTFAYIDEDTIAPSFTFHYNSWSPNSFKLDLSLNVMDSVWYICGFMDTAYYRLDSIGSIMDMQSQSRKAYYFTVNFYKVSSNTGLFTYVEGIGSFFGPTISDIQHPFRLCNLHHPVNKIICVKDGDDNLIYRASDEDSCTRKISVDEFKLTDYSVYPNPASETILVSFSETTNLRGGRFNLYDSFGKLVLDQDISENLLQKISVSHLPDGLYLLHLQTNDGQVWLTEIVVVLKQ